MKTDLVIEGEGRAGVGSIGRSTGSLAERPN